MSSVMVMTSVDINGDASSRSITMEPQPRGHATATTPPSGAAAAAHANDGTHLVGAVGSLNSTTTNTSYGIKTHPAPAGS